MFFLITFTLILIVIYCFYQWYIGKYQYWARQGVPYDRDVSFPFGNASEVFRGRTQIAKFFGRLYSRNSHVPYFGIFILNKPYLVLRDPYVIRDVLITDFHNFSDRIFACDHTVDPIAGNSVFLLRNPRWRHVRAKLTSIFTSSKLKLMLPLMTCVGRQLDNYLTAEERPIVADVKEIAAMYLTDLTAVCFFGLQTNTLRNQSDDGIFRNVGRRMFDFNVARVSFSMFAYFFLPSVVRLLRLSFADPVSVDFMRSVFKDALAERRKSGTVRNDFVDLLLALRQDEDSCFDEDTMISQAITFFVAGFESTSNVLSFTIYELALHPDVQTKLRHEIHTVFDAAADFDNAIKLDKLTQLKYMDMVLAETLRKYPFAPFLNRKCKNSYTIRQTGYVVPAGTEILVPTDGLHYDPKYFPDPEKFVPDRFLPEVKYTTSTYMPFGAGPRFCIGDRFGILAAKVGLLYFFRKFKVEPCPSTPIPLVLNPRSPFVMSNEGLPLKIIPSTTVSGA